MNTKFLLISLLILLYSVNGFSQKIIKLAQKGIVPQVNYVSEVPFRYENEHLFIDVNINGEIYNFLFDTGFDISAIDLNIFKDSSYKKVLKKNVSGSAIKKQKVQFILIPTLSIAEIDFNEVGASFIDLSFINKNYICSKNPIAGVIGANILRKANWQINYKNQVIIFSDSSLNDNLSEKAIKIEMISKSWGSPLVNVNINGMQKKFTIDTGSGGAITTGTEFKEQLELSNDKIKFVSITKEDASNNTYTNYHALIDLIEINDLNLKNQVISLEKGVSSLIGNQLFENFTIIFDWKNNTIFLDPEKEIKNESISEYEILLKPNYTNNKIEINGFYNILQSNKNYKIGTEILKINNTDVSNFSTQKLCDFWSSEWKKIKSKGKVVIDLGTEKIELVKTQLFIK